VYRLAWFTTLAICVPSYYPTPLLHTVCSTLRHRLLASTSPHTHTVDDISLLRLVSQTASLVRARWAGSAVDDVELAELELMYSQQMFNEYDQSTGTGFRRALCRSWMV
jgi:hypothetical protein